MAYDIQHVRDEDRLPWLETVEPDNARAAGAGRIAAMVMLGLAILAAIVFAVFRVGGPHPVAAGGGGELIAAQDGDYKVKPDDPGGLHLSGEGEAAVATSTGAGPGGGRIDSTQVPERPVAGRRAAPAAAHGGATAPVPVPGGKLAAPAPMTTPKANVPGAASGGSLVQLGAFPSEAVANAAWSAMAKRFGYVASLGKSVEAADVNGRHVFRLRLNAGSAGAAADICGRLKVAGEDCFIVAG